MKKLIYNLCFLLISINLYSQDSKPKSYYCDLKFEQEDSAYFISNVVTVDSTSSEQLFKKAKIWIAENFNSAKNVIQAEDKDAGFIICKGNLSLEKLERTLYFKIKMEFKNEKYRIRFFDMSVKADLLPKLDTYPTLSDLDKGSERSVELMFKNWKDRKDLKAIDAITKCDIMKTIDSLLESFKKQLLKKDGW